MGGRVYIGVILGLYRVLLGLFWDNGKGNGNYYLGGLKIGVEVMGILGVSCKDSQISLNIDQVFKDAF